MNNLQNKCQGPLVGEAVAANIIDASLGNDDIPDCFKYKIQLLNYEPLL